MIDKRVNLFRGAQADASAGRGSMSPGTSGTGGMRGGNGGNNREDRRSGQYGQKRTTVQKGTLSDPMEKKDFFTQSYKGPSIFGLGGGYKNLNVPGDTSKGFKSGIGSSILGGILGLINPVLGLGYRAITRAPGVFDKFKSSSTLEQFRDKLRGYGRTMPVYSNNPMFGGIDSLRTDLNIDSRFQDYLDFQKSTPDDVTFEEYLENIQNAPTGILQSSVLPSNNLVAGLTKMQKAGLKSKKKAVDMGLFSPQEALDSIAPFNDPNDPATLEEVKEYYGIV